MAVKLIDNFARSLTVSTLMLTISSPSQVYAKLDVRIVSQSPAVEAERSRGSPKLTCRISSSAFARTELFFGSLRPNGQVSDAEFQAFINREITPRFPDGLTLLSGFGQFKNSKGIVIQERSRLLILLYPIDQINSSSHKIDLIRQAYNKAFQQESVLRTDEPSCVSF